MWEDTYGVNDPGCYAYGYSDEEEGQSVALNIVNFGDDSEDSSPSESPVLRSVGEMQYELNETGYSYDDPDDTFRAKSSMEDISGCYSNGTSPPSDGYGYAPVSTPSGYGSGYSDPVADGLASAYDDPGSTEDLESKRAPPTLLEQTSEIPSHFHSFTEFFKFVQKKNMAISIEKPSMKLTRSLRFSGHTGTAEKMADFVKSYLGSNLEEESEWDDLEREGKRRDWNTEFQQLVELPDSRIKFLGLRNLAHDFVYAAETYGRIIISEHCLPMEMKTIKPLDIGGVAGGLKFICQGILFKFAVDYTGLYGGDENAMKTASHELKGLTNYFHCGVEDLRVPLMAFIDYRGFRLMALSLLPISSTTLCYGSADAGKTVRNTNLRMNAIAKSVGEILNLKEHKVGSLQTPIYGPGDIEGHMGADGRLYMLDFARVAPPQPPTQRGAQLFNLYRMEFVTQYEKPLCSDCFTSFAAHNKEEHNGENREAFLHYLHQILPSVAEELDQVDMNNTSQSELVKLIHSRGVNVRHIGRLRTSCQQAGVKKSLLLEGIARTIKSHLHELFRREMRVCSVPSEKPFRQVVLDLFNLILGNNPDFSSMYWRVQLKEKLQQKFRHILSEEEASEEFDLSSTLSMSGLFQRVQELTSVILSAELLEQLDTQPGEVEVVDPDLSLRSRSVHLNIIDYADGMALYYEAENRNDNPNTQRRLLRLARVRLEASLSQSGHANYTAILQLGNINRSLAVRSTGSESEEYFQKAAAAFERLTKSNCPISLKHQAYVLWAKTMWKQVKQSQNTNDEHVEPIRNLIQHSLELQPGDNSSIILQAKILFRQGVDNFRIQKHTNAQQHLEEALTLLTRSRSTKNIELQPEMSTDLMFMQARIQIHLLMNEMEAKEDETDREVILPQMKAFAYFCQKVLQFSPDLPLFKHVFLYRWSTLALLGCMQYAPETLLPAVAALFNARQVETLVLDATLFDWVANRECFVSLLQSCTSITRLRIQQVPLRELKLHEMLSQSPHVKHLEFDQVLCGAAEIELMKTGAYALESLQFNNVSFDTTVTNDHLLSIFESLPPQLQVLHVRGMSFEMGDLWTRWIESLPTTLKELDLVSVDHFANEQLQKLGEHIPHLVALVLIQCPRLDDDQLLSAFSAVEHLNVSGCEFAFTPQLSQPEAHPLLRTLVDKNGLVSTFSPREVALRPQKSFAANCMFTIDTIPIHLRIERRTIGTCQVSFHCRLQQKHERDSYLAAAQSVELATCSFRHLGTMAICEFSSRISGTLEQARWQYNKAIPMVRPSVSSFSNPM